MEINRSISFVLTCFIALLMASPLNAQDGTSFSYQGRLLQGSNSFDGTAEFLFGIYYERGGVEEFVWTSDPDATLSPTAAGNPVVLNVSRGSFRVQIGDSSIPGMAPLDDSIWNEDGRYFLRVWVRASTSEPFELLSPDQRISNPSSFGREARREKTIYVDPVLGDDRRTGLKPSRPKRTLEAAIRVVPPFLRSRVTIQLAAGTYHEGVLVANIFAFGEDAGLTIKGNSVTPANVILTGLSETTSTLVVEESGIRIRDVGGPITIEGITFGSYKRAGIHVDLGGRATIAKCAFNNPVVGDTFGILVWGGAEATDLTFTGFNGFQASNSGFLIVRNANVNACAGFGAQATNLGTLAILDSRFTNCPNTALRIRGGSVNTLRTYFENPAGGSDYAVVVYHNGIARFEDCDFVGNFPGAVRAHSGGSVLFSRIPTSMDGNGVGLRIESNGSAQNTGGTNLVFNGNTSNTQTDSSGVYVTTNE